MTLADQLNRLTEDIETSRLPDVDDIRRAGARRRARRTRAAVLVATVLVLVLAVGAALTAVHRPAPPTPARTPDGAAAALRLRLAAVVELPNPTNAVVADGSLWVVGGDTGVLAEVDPVRNTIKRQVRLPHPADSVAAMPGSTALWVASTSDDLVMRVDRGSLRVTATLRSTPSAPLDQPVGIIAVDDGIWLTNHGSTPSTAVKLNERSGAVMRVVTLPGTAATGPIPVRIDQTYLWFLIGSPPQIFIVGTTGQDRLSGTFSGEIACGQGQTIYGRPVYTDGTDPACHGPAKRVDELGYSPAEIFGSGLSLDSVAAAAGQAWASDHSRRLYLVDVNTLQATPAATLERPSTMNRLVSTGQAIWVLRGRTNQLVKLEPSMTPPSGR
jgi:hypothetical protein